MKTYSILLVDDDPLILKGTGRDLQDLGYAVTTADSGEQAQALLAEQKFHLVITDLVMDEVDGIQVLKTAKQIDPQIMVIILTGHGDMETAIEALRLNADDYLLKPCIPQELYFKVSRCLEKMELHLSIKNYENILPVCCVCKKIRDDLGKDRRTGKWMSVEHYIYKRGGVSPTSSYCPDCLKQALKE